MSLKEVLKFFGFGFGKITPNVYERENEIHVEFIFNGNINPKLASVDVSKEVIGKETEEVEINLYEVDEETRWEITNILGLTNKEQHRLSNDLSEIDIGEHFAVDDSGDDIFVRFNYERKKKKIKVSVKPKTPFVSHSVASFCCYRNSVLSDEASINKGEDKLDIMFPLRGGVSDAMEYTEESKFKKFKNKFKN